MLASLTIYYIVEGYVKKQNPRFGHPTGAVIIFGILFSVIYYAAKGMSHADYLEFQFRPGVFWNLIIPPIFIHKGYNLKTH